ncbi:MAG: DUF3500 domain-containing protein [Verrucomicrobiota bacterium]
MKTPLFVILFVLVGSKFLFAQKVGEYPSLPSKVLTEYQPTSPTEASAKFSAKRANKFLDSLDADRLKEASLPYDSPEKAIWTNVPPRGEQGGVRLGDLNEKQLKLACDLLAAVLSPQGYSKAFGIPLADDLLLRNGERRPGFGAEDYWLAIFGDPSPTDPWALQFDGHHLAINLAFQGDAMTMSPTFIGTQPRGFELDGETMEPMQGKDAAALTLFRTLDKGQKKEATMGRKRSNLKAGAGKDGFVPKAEGITAKDFNEKQREALMNVIRLYVEDLPPPFAERRMKELASEADQIKFAWWGPAEDGGDYSYRIQGPSLIIEFAGQDLGGDPHDHLHSIYRDPTNEYGARLGEK